MKKFTYFFVLIMVLSIYLSGCSESKATVSKMDFDKFMAMTYEDTGESGLAACTIADVEKKEKLKKEVQYRSTLFVEDKERIMYIDEENVLYIRPLKGESVTLKKDVDHFMIYGQNAKKVAVGIYDSQDDALADIYFFDIQNGEKEKIVADVRDFKITPDFSVMAFRNNDSDLYIKCADNDKDKIASDVSAFTLSPDGKKVCINRKNRFYLYESEKGDKEKIATDPYFYPPVFRADGSILYMLSDESSHMTGTLYIKKPNQEPDKIASDVNKYVDTAKGIYYLNSDAQVYLIKEETKEKIASSVTFFNVSSDGNMFIYMNDDAILYRIKNNEKKEKLISDLTDWDFNGERFVCITYENDLYVIDPQKEKSKVDTDVKNFLLQPYSNNVAYVTTDNQIKLYKTQATKETTVFENAKEYNRIYFGNQLLYERNLSLSDLKGIWEFRIDKEGMPEKLTHLFIKSTNENLDFYAMGTKIFSSKVNLEPSSLTSGILTMTEIKKEDTPQLAEVEKFSGSKFPEPEIGSSIAAEIKGDTLLFDGDQLSKVNKETFDATTKEQATIISNVNKSMETAKDIQYAEYGYMNQDGNLREGPGTDHNIITTLTKDTDFYINDTDISEDGKLWLNISVYVYDEADDYGDYTSGWVSYKLIKIQE